ncbi:hypothetical protein FTX61_13375 [Nitriliruptoraceae bacterium ZYF776]|nr:hypothetical protein [Profundirhabdus halotolerans]
MRTDTRSPTRSADRRRGRTRVLLGLEVLLAVGAYGGAAAILTGVLDFGEATDRLPFGSLVLAGLALAVVNGVLPTVALVLDRRRHPAAPLAHLAVGLALVSWIVVQVGFLGPPVHALQVLYLVWGVAIAGLALPEARVSWRVVGRAR